MLENIKLILNISDDKYDAMIMLYLAKVETMVVEYCNVNELTEGLKSFIEDKVVSIMRNLINSSTKNTGEIKSVTRGDTKIDYNVTDKSIGVNLTDEDRMFLNQFRKLRFF